MYTTSIQTFLSYLDYFNSLPTIPIFIILSQNPCFSTLLALFSVIDTVYIKFVFVSSETLFLVHRIPFLTQSFQPCRIIQIPVHEFPVPNSQYLRVLSNNYFTLQTFDNISLTIYRFLKLNTYICWAIKYKFSLLIHYISFMCFKYTYNMNIYNLYVNIHIMHVLYRIHMYVICITDWFNSQVSLLTTIFIQ